MAWILPNDGKLIEWSSSTDFCFRAFTIIICCSIPFPLPLPPLLFLYPFLFLSITLSPFPVLFLYSFYL
ncbi:hypothetical protein ES332_D01G144500v1 [Gossypium tomentosum]|uniref:Uncharacterized protein n=1 Tax=Gossypium tomentosum TaxID=34277 RepID=A0A5D2M905_GOSTO|nr:hypothetical protein ES332_D01G144500v1 [Gossypium tomentosum]